jgi:8-oxo-dGTP pyrophosphatase MutT (NUDIX family)
MKSYNFCNNCGKTGHLFHQCKSPITSSGVIAFRIRDDNVREYLMICRKDTLGYVDFIRGKYPPNDKAYLLNIFSEMTVAEKESLLVKDFSDMWQSLWGRDVGIQYRGEEKASKQKFEKLRDGMSMGDSDCSIGGLIKESGEGWSDPEWGFPKGRRNYHEKDLLCGLREFEEETGFSRNDVTIIQNVQPVEETFTGSNFKSYRHKYFLGCMRNDVPILHEQYESSEVSQMKWGTYEECMNYIRPYNVEKKKALSSIQHVLSRYTLYS